MFKVGDWVRWTCRCSGDCQELTASKALFRIDHIRSDGSIFIVKRDGSGYRGCTAEQIFLDRFLGAVQEALSQAAAKPAARGAAPRRAKAADSK